MADRGTIDGGHQLALLRSLVDGQRFIVAADVLVAAAGLAERLMELGAADVFVVGGSRGTGPVDAEVERDAVDLRLSGTSIMDGVRRFEAAIADPPRYLIDAIDAFDPTGEAKVIVPVFGADELFGRPAFGARRAEWRALEDKTLADALWDRAGVVRALSRIVPAELAALRSAAQELDAGSGTVWVADNRRGWHGGGESLRWVRDGSDAEVAHRYLADNADLVRVMPFLDGVPCSIHGWVIGDEVATFRPCEMVVLRVRGASELRYAGAATAWRPSAADTEELRGIARRVGALLRDEVDYRGVFTVDGVLTADGFRPTELNPRFGVGLSLLGRGGDLPLFLLHCATIDHPEYDWRPDELERVVLAVSNDTPVAMAHTLVRERIEEPSEVAICRQGEGFVAVGPDAEPDGMLVLGPASSGGLLRVTFDRFEDGALVAPQAARAFSYAREPFGLDLPELDPAPNLRPA